MEVSIEERVQELWIKNGILSYNETISSFPEESASDIRRACSKLKKKGDVYNLRTEFFNGKCREKASLAANKRWDQYEKKNFSVSKNTNISQSSCFTDGMTWICGD